MFFFVEFLFLYLFLFCCCCRFVCFVCFCLFCLFLFVLLFVLLFVFASVYHNCKKALDVRDQASYHMVLFFFFLQKENSLVMVLYDGLRAVNGLKKDAEKTVCWD